MSEPRLSGNQLAASIRAEVAERAGKLTAAGTVPTLAVVTATDDEASAWYVRSIAKAAEKVGIACQVVDLGPAATTEQITTTLDDLSADGGVHGVMLQTPLPACERSEDLAGAIAAHKDVDGANPLSLGRLAAGLDAFPPATAQAVMEVIDNHGVELAGKHVVVVGRSTVVGKPVAHLLLHRHATVTICHSRTTDLPSITGEADVLVVAVGRPGLITGKHVKPGVVVIDVGTNPTDDGGLVGDVDAASVLEVAEYLSPVPGGVGPVTTAVLLRNTVDAADRFLPHTRPI